MTARNWMERIPLTSAQLPGVLGFGGEWKLRLWFQP